MQIYQLAALAHTEENAIFHEFKNCSY
jgi:hypothetical protein